MKERILGAAILWNDGTLMVSSCHALAWEAGPEDRHGHEEGFLTSRQRFVSREEAAELTTGKRFFLTSEQVIAA